MKRASCLIREAPEYRRSAFLCGLAAAGYAIRYDAFVPEPGDVLVIWNRYGRFHAEACRFEAQGAAVVVVENGYVNWRASWHDRRRYAMALGGHNGSGRWPGHGIDYPPGAAVEQRLWDLGVEFQSWRTSGRHILVCGQRGIGAPAMASPRGWEDQVSRRLAALTDRPIRVRRHPGNKDHDVPLSRDLADAWACVVWSSGCANEALRLGVPVFYEAPSIVAAKAACHNIAEIETPSFGDRIAAFVDIAWSQWSLAEIEAGLPFSILLAQ